MGNSDDLHLRRPEPIDQPERETVSKPADDDPRRVSVRAPGAHPTVSRLFRPRQEIRRPALIRDRCSTWRRRAIPSLRRVKFDLHRGFSSVRALASTSSAGIAVTAPESSSRLRRCAYSSQACSTPGSGGPSSSSTNARKRRSCSSGFSPRISLSLPKPFVPSD